MMDKDKIVEKNRYDRRAKLRLSRREPIDDGVSKNITGEPEKWYFDYFKDLSPRAEILEIGAGMGENTRKLLEMGFSVHATDVSPLSVEVMKQEFASFDKFTASVADMEDLNFPDASFDVVCSAGSLSYGDNEIVMNEIARILRSGGHFIVLDSLNDNPIYRFNRFIRFLRGHRSLATLKRMPTTRLINEYGARFGIIQTRYFGGGLWLTPLLRTFLSDHKTLSLVLYIDRVLRVRRSAFKFTMRVTKI